MNLTTRIEVLRVEYHRAQGLADKTERRMREARQANHTAQISAQDAYRKLDQALNEREAELSTSRPGEKHSLPRESYIVWLLAGKGTGGRIRLATANSEAKARSVAALMLSKLALELTRSHS